MQTQRTEPRKTVRWLSTLLLFGVALTLMLPSAALADGTLAGTPITNTATIAFSAGGAPQGTVSSNTVSFLVDRKVDLTVARLGGTYTYTAPGFNGAVTAFSVTNDGNAPFNFILTADNGTDDPFAAPATDDGDVIFPVPATYVDSDGNSIYESGTDTATSISSLGIDATVTVFVLADIPAGASNLDVFSVMLVAEARETDGSLLPEDNGANSDAMETIWVDGAGDHVTDGPRDSRHSATHAYQVRTGYVTVSKSAAAIWDPFNWDTNPKAVPGAYVQYTITVAHDGSVPFSATLTSLSDVLNANTTFDPDLIQASNSATPSPESVGGEGFRLNVPAGRGWTGDVGYFTTASDGDGATYDGTNTVTLDFTTLLPSEAGYAAGELLSGESVTITFNVLVD